jgi:hypothetical protein
VALQIAFKAINDTAGPDGIVPTLLVYSALPRLSEYDPPSPTIAQRSNALRKAIAEIKSLRARHEITRALNTRNGPSTTDIHELPLNSEVLVWREGNTGQLGQWDEPYKLVFIEDERCVLALPHGNTSFRSTSVKPFLREDKSLDLDDSSPDSEHNHDGQGDAGMIPPAMPPKRGRGRPRKTPPEVTVYL